MMLYLTGASASLMKSNESAQMDPGQSLGGYISSTPVPNASLNTLFDIISIQTLKDKPKETIGLGLINKFSKSVTDVRVKIITHKNNIANFKLAAVSVDNMIMENIDNRYAEPIQADFYDINFTRTAVTVTITNPMEIGEVVYLEPFNVSAEAEAAGFDGTYNAIKQAFSNSINYQVSRLTENTFYIESNDDTAIAAPLDCSYTATAQATFSFDGKFRNETNNEKLISTNLNSGEAIGLWLQRDISDIEYPTDEELIDDYDNQKINENLEEVELLISYNLSE